jgi:hypothetical protein
MNFCPYGKYKIFKKRETQLLNLTLDCELETIIKTMKQETGNVSELKLKAGVSRYNDSNMVIKGVLW